MKIRAMYVAAMCCKKGEETVRGTRGGGSRGGAFAVDDQRIQWDLGSRYDSTEISYCPHCAAHLPSEIPDIDMSVDR